MPPLPVEPPSVGRGPPPSTFAVPPGGIFRPAVADLNLDFAPYTKPGPPSPIP